MKVRHGIHGIHGKHENEHRVRTSFPATAPVVEREPECLPDWTFLGFADAGFLCTRVGEN